MFFNKVAYTNLNLAILKKMKALITSLIFIFIYQFSYGQEWETVAYLPGNFEVKQLEVVSENKIYVAAKNQKLIHWNGNQWSTIGDFDPLYVPVFQYNAADDIYATHNDYISGDGQTYYNYIAHWDGSVWSNTGNLNSAKTITNFKVINPNEIYAVGNFVLEGYNWKPVAEYNGSDWEVVGLGDENAGAYATYANLWVNDADDIYATSGYSDIGVIRIKHWDGMNWSVLYNSDDSVNRLSKTFPVSENEVYSFGYENGSGNSCIALWDGEIWEPLGDIRGDLDLSTSGNNGGMTYRYVKQNEIYAVGSALKDANNLTFEVAKWNGTNWEEVGSLDADKQAAVLDIYNGYLYVAGDLTELSPSGNRVTVIKRYYIDALFISATSNPIEGGTVEGTGVFASGEMATLTAMPNINYVFENWTENGQIVSTEPVYEFTVDPDRELVANFQIEMSVPNYDSESLVVFPNPFTNSISLKISKSSIDKVQVFDLLGRLVIDVPGNNSDSMKLEIQNLEKGNYILKIHTDSGIQSIRIIKN